MELQIISNQISIIRQQRVLLDFELAAMYEVETRVLKQAVRRNQSRFPDDFMFQLTKQEWNEVITNRDNLPSNAQFGASTPFAFTEQGVAMLSSVLRSDKAVEVNIAIMRAFVLLRKHLSDYKTLVAKIEELEASMEKRFSTINEALEYLLAEPPATQRTPIGFPQKGRS